MSAMAACVKRPRLHYRVFSSPARGFRHAWPASPLAFLPSFWRILKSWRAALCLDSMWPAQVAARRVIKMAIFNNRRLACLLARPGLACVGGDLSLKIVFCSARRGGLRPLGHVVRTEITCRIDRAGLARPAGLDCVMRRSCPVIAYLAPHLRGSKRGWALFYLRH